MSGVICIGECMVELRPRPDGAFERGFAGDAYNAAVYLKRTAPEQRVRFLSAVGTDAMSAAMRETWRAAGVEDDLAFAVPDAVPGLYMINLDQRGERSFIYWRGQSAARRWFDQLVAHGGAAVLAGADLVYFSGISLAILSDEQRLEALDLLADAKNRGVRLAFDPNYRAALWADPTLAQKRLRAAMEIADIFLPSQEDLDALDLTPPPAAESVITDGAHGCRVITPELRMTIPTALSGAIVDTSGAGDSFTGAYLARRLQGRSVREAAETALAVASRVVTARGAIVPAEISHPTAEGSHV